jgi:DHA2 family multidrug resistance protein
MAAEAVSADPNKVVLAPIPRDRVLLLATALLGYLLINSSGQFVGSNLVDVQGGIGASADEASWLNTAYVMALFGGIVCSSALIATFGLRRYLAASALLFGVAALACAAAPPLPLMIGLRAIQGFAAGGLGPIAFVAIFTTTAGPRLPFGLSLLALVLLLPATFGPAMSGLLEDRLGWEGLFLIQAAIGAAVASASTLLMPASPIGWAALRRDWTSLLLLSVALAATLLVLGQGTRRYWLDSALIAWTLAIGAGAWAGFLLALWRSPMPIISFALLGRRGFIVPISLNLLFRIGLASTAFLIPQYLVVVQGYRPLELGNLFLWAAIPQLLAYPLTWWLLKQVDGRWVIAAGLVLFGLSAILASDGTSLAAADQLRVVMMLGGAGQVLFLVPNLIAGGGQLTAPDGPTASLLFNATTIGGTNLGVALATELVTERHKFHLGALAESAAAYGPKLDRIEALAQGFASHVGDDSIAGARGIAILAASLRREAWVLSFNDGFLLVGAVVIAAAAGLLLVPSQPPLGGSLTRDRRLP